MFKAPFSFEGRIRRTEYGLSNIIYTIFLIVLFVLAMNVPSASFAFILIIPMMWFRLAQAAKRSHDLGNSGWFILIPLYGFWLLFGPGIAGENEYGEDPKEQGMVEVSPIDRMQ
jgi:uncharacterized membrane protein YhaH (DUF805 family)